MIMLNVMTDKCCKSGRIWSLLELIKTITHSKQLLATLTCGLEPYKLKTILGWNYGKRTLAIMPFLWTRNWLNLPYAYGMNSISQNAGFSLLEGMRESPPHQPKICYPLTRKNFRPHQTFIPPPPKVNFPH